MKAARFEDLPMTRTCNQCGEEKPREQMMIVRTEGSYYFRPKCKDCNNAKERGHRREYKKKYLDNWRKRNADLEKSYRQTDPSRQKAAERSYRYFKANHAAILIKKRLAYRDIAVTLAEAKELLERFGPCYPTRQGLTKAGLRECERIRSRLRVRNVDRRRRQTATEIRMMIYEEDARFVIQPDQQEMPYKSRSERMKQHFRNKRVMSWVSIFKNSRSCPISSLPSTNENVSELAQRSVSKSLSGLATCQHSSDASNCSKLNQPEDHKP